MHTLTIRRKRPQEAGQEASPEASPATGLDVDGPRSLTPAPSSLVVLGRAVAEPATQRLSHDALLDDVGRIADDPEDLCGEAPGPEVDCGRRQCLLPLAPLILATKAGLSPHGRCHQGRHGRDIQAPQPARKDIVRDPERTEARAEDERGAQSPVQAASDAMVAYDAPCTVNWPGVEALLSGRRVLYLKPCLDMLHGRRKQRHGPATQETRGCVPVEREMW